MSTPVVITLIGVVRSTRTVLSDDDWDGEEVHVDLDTAMVSEGALSGIQDFSHVEVLFHMDRVDAAKIETTARHPRNNLDWPKIGILVQ